MVLVCVPARLCLRLFIRARSTLSKIEKILHSIGKVLMGEEIPHPWRVEAQQRHPKVSHIRIALLDLEAGLDAFRCRKRETDSLERR